MKATLSHDIRGSVILWLDHILCSDGQGFNTYTGIFYNKGQSDMYNGLYSQVSPPRQWVYDSSVSGAIIPTGIYNNSVLTGRSNSLILDFLRGEVLSQTPLGNVSGVVSYKEVNVYASNRSEEFLLFDKQYKKNPVTFPPYTGFAPMDRPAPCIFVKQQAPNNKIISFERYSETVTPVRLIFIANSEYMFEAVTSLIADKKELHIPLFMASEMPITQYGDITGVFNYSAAATSIQNSSNGNRICQIKDVKISTFTDAVNYFIHPDAVGGFVDLDLLNVRAI